MSAYVVAQIRIDDPEEYQKYLDGFLPSFELHGGELLATSQNETTVVEGEWMYPCTVILRFPTLAAARNWYNDPDYTALIVHRHRAARTNLVMVEGFDR